VFDLYAITPERPAAEIETKLRAMLVGAPRGRIAVQLRAKHLPHAELRGLAQSLRALTAEHGVLLLIGSADIELAVEVTADGVQLPERGPSVASARAVLGSSPLLGASRHDLEGVRAAGSDGASFVTLSPVFSVPQKGEPLGVERFAAIAGASSVPVLALGGIGAASTSELVRRGAHGVAVIRELFDAPHPADALRELLAAVDAGRRSQRTR
jgi:thiamine-phosphate pyrophosphorylase